MQLLARFLVVLALAFWQGGFMFYGAVVITIGNDELGPDGQGAITRRVTHALNLTGGVALAILALELTRSGKASLTPRLLSWIVWAGLVATLLALVWMHVPMDRILDRDPPLGHERRDFRDWHRWYLRTSTLQCLLALAFVWLRLMAWRQQDRRFQAETLPGADARSYTESSSPFSSTGRAADS